MLSYNQGLKLGEVLRLLRKEKGFNQEHLANLLNIKRQTYSAWERDVSSPDVSTVNQLAELYGVSIDYLLGKGPRNIDTPSNIFPLKTKAVPLLGEIVAGQPRYAEEQCEYYIEIDDVIKADFCLKVKGDSMINARINDGDIVFVRKQPDVEDGEIAVVRIDDEATLKRVYKMPGRLQLRAENPNYAPIDIIESDFKDVEILGKAVAFQSKIK